MWHKKIDETEGDKVIYEGTKVKSIFQFWYLPSFYWKRKKKEDVIVLCWGLTEICMVNLAGWEIASE